MGDADVQEGMYLTDGKKLICVERVTSIGIDAEDAQVPGKLISLPRTIVEREWKKVEVQDDAA